MTRHLGLLISWLTRKPRCIAFLTDQEPRCTDFLAGVSESSVQLFKYTGSVSNSSFESTLYQGVLTSGLVATFRFRYVGALTVFLGVLASSVR